MRKTSENNRIYRQFLRLSLITICLLGGSTAAFPQNKRVYRDDGCGAVRWSSQSPYGANHTGVFDLQVKEQTIAAPPKKLLVDAGKNGGIRVKGWNRNEVYIKACVQAFGRDETEAAAQTSAVRVEIAEGVIRAVSSTVSDDNTNYSFSASATTFAFPSTLICH